MAGGSTSSACECCADVRKHFCVVPTWRNAVLIVFLVGAIVGMVVLISTGLLEQWADLVEVHIGWPGHFIFFGILLYTGLPFGYGWSFFCIANAYVHGWPAVISNEVGTICGAALGFTVSRRCLRRTIEAKVSSLPRRWVTTIRAIQTEVKRSTLGFLGLTALLRNSGLPIGLTNAFDATLTDASLRLSLLGALIATQPTLVISTYIGTLVKSWGGLAGMFGGGGALTAQERSARNVSIIVQIVIAVVLLVAFGTWARHRLRKLTGGAAAVAPAEAGEAAEAGTSTHARCGSPRAPAAAEGGGDDAGINGMPLHLDISAHSRELES